MPTHSPFNLRLCSLLSLLFSLSLHAANEEIRLSTPPTATEEATQPSLFPSAQSKYIIPDFAQPGERNEDIKTPEALTDEEAMVLRSIANMNNEELSDLLQVYERMGNLAMVQSLSRALLIRVPDHPIARQMLDGTNNTSEVRKPGYLEKMAEEVLAGKKSSDPDAVGTQARVLIAAKQSEQAIALLEALQRTTFTSQAFPYLEDLAYAHLERQQWAQAEAAFAQVLKQKTLPASQRQRITQQHELAQIEQRIATIRAKSYADPDAALRESATVLSDQPEHPSAIAFRIECLQYAGKNTEALALLQQLKDAVANAPAFAYQRQLGDTQLQMKQWAAAQTSFEELRSNPIFAKEARNDASKAITNAAISKQGEEALLAAGFGDMEKAEALIADLESQYPTLLEVFSYRCALLARLGRGDEALRLLEDKKAALASTGKPFPLQDTIGDVQLARKQFDLSRTAYRAILDEPKYDWSMRRRALDAMPAIHRVELMEAGFIALRDRRIDRAKAAAKSLHEEFGFNARELKLLTAEIHLAQNKTHAAVAELEALRQTTPAQTPFEATSSLATGYMRIGRQAEALQAYNDILAHHRAYTPYEHMQARWEQRAALPLARPSLETRVSHRRETDGSATRADIEYTGPWWGNWRAQAFTHADSFKSKAPSLIVDSPAMQERYDAGIRLQRRIGEAFAAEATLGSSQSDLLYGARVGNFLNPGLNWYAAFTGNARSTESLPLELLDARENRFDVDYGGPLPGPWNFNLHASANWVRVGNKAMGRGLGVSGSLEYVIQTETDKRPEITVGLLSEYRRFTPGEASADLASLVDNTTNRHGITLAYRQNLNDSWRLTAQVGELYAFDENSFQGMASLNVSHYFNEQFLAYLELRYDSNSRSAQQDSGAFEASLGLMHSF